MTAISTSASGLSAAKVFCIGFHKTGTKSLGRALAILGYRVCGPVGARDPLIADRVMVHVRSVLERFDAFQDNPWPILFQELDALCPGSRFILTRRPAEIWIDSVVRHFGHNDTPMRQWIYGTGHPSGHEATYLARYRKHNECVRAHFRSRSDDLLELDLAAGLDWQPLCDFLGKPVPDLAFPHINKRTDRLDGGTDRR